MASQSQIEWTELTWNPVRGCTRVSEGCRFCYAERIAQRFAGKGLAYEGLATQTKAGPRWTNRIKRVPHLLEQPLKWKNPKLIFVNSMSDLFHEAVSPQYIRQIFDVMKRSNWHHFQVLTKRAERLEELSPEIDWPENVWMGVSVENQDYISRINHLRKTNAKSLFEKSFDSVSHQVNGSDVNHSFSSLRIAFIVHSQATKPAKPRKCALNNPS